MIRHKPFITVVVVLVIGFGLWFVIDKFIVWHQANQDTKDYQLALSLLKSSLGNSYDSTQLTESGEQCNSGTGNAPFGGVSESGCSLKFTYLLASQNADLSTMATYDINLKQMLSEYMYKLSAHGWFTIDPPNSSVDTTTSNGYTYIRTLFDKSSGGCRVTVDAEKQDSSLAVKGDVEAYCVWET